MSELHLGFLHTSKLNPYTPTICERPVSYHSFHLDCPQFSDVYLKMSIEFTSTDVFRSKLSKAGLMNIFSLFAVSICIYKRVSRCLLKRPLPLVII